MPARYRWSPPRDRSEIEATIPKNVLCERLVALGPEKLSQLDAAIRFALGLD